MVKHIQRGKHNNGFTLIELLVVLVIIAGLLTIVSPNYFKNIDYANEVVMRDNLSALRKSIDLFKEDKGRYPSTLDELVSEKYLRNIPMDPLTRKSTWLEIKEANGVVDVHSLSNKTALNGIRYADW